MTVRTMPAVRFPWLTSSVTVNQPMRLLAESDPPLTEGTVTAVTCGARRRDAAVAANAPESAASSSRPLRATTITIRDEGVSRSGPARAGSRYPAG